MGETYRCGNLQLRRQYNLDNNLRAVIKNDNDLITADSVSQNNLDNLDKKLAHMRIKTVQKYLR